MIIFMLILLFSVNHSLYGAEAFDDSNLDIENVSLDEGADSTIDAGDETLDVSEDVADMVSAVDDTSLDVPQDSDVKDDDLAEGQGGSLSEENIQVKSDEDQQGVTQEPEPSVSVEKKDEAGSLEDLDMIKDSSVDESPHDEGGANAKVGDLVVENEEQQVVAGEDPHKKMLTEESSEKDEDMGKNVDEDNVVESEDIDNEDAEYGIHTISVKGASGNWLYKRWWFEKAGTLYDKIKKAFAQILDSRMYFFEQRVNLDRVVLDPFYQAIGIVHNELQDNIAMLLAKAEEYKNTSNQKDGKVSAITILQEEQKTLANLQNEVAAVRDINRAINDALHKLMGQINMCRQWEQDVWHRYRSIANELSDKVARDHYYAIAASWKNIKQVQQYIRGEYSHHFEALIQDAKVRVKKIQKSMENLKEKGIDLKKVTHDFIENLDKNTTEKDQDDDDSDDDDGQEDEGEETGWWAQIKSVLWAPFGAIGSAWQAIFG